MVLSAWKGLDGGVLTDANGAVILCETCPCDVDSPDGCGTTDWISTVQIPLTPSPGFQIQATGTVTSPTFYTGGYWEWEIYRNGGLIGGPAENAVSSGTQPIGLSIFVDDIPGDVFLFRARFHRPAGLAHLITGEIAPECYGPWDEITHVLT